MRNFVFEADIIVPRLELKRHRFSLDRDALAAVMALIPPLTLPDDLTLEDVRDLIVGDGQYMTVLKLKGDNKARMRILEAIAAHAWLNDIPWTVTQTSDYGPGDPRFDKLVNTYMESNNA